MQLRSNGIRPHVYDMPNEPNPLDRQYTKRGKTYQDSDLYYFVPDQPTLARSYVNYKGEDLSNSLDGYMAKKEFREHKFKNIETMLNYLERHNVTTKIVGNDIIAENVAYRSDKYPKEFREKANRYDSWKRKEVYRLDYVDDPSVEGVGDPIFHTGKRTEPAGSVRKSLKIFGRENIDKNVQRERDNINPMEVRKYDVGRWSDYFFHGIDHNACMILGFDGTDLRIGEYKNVESHFGGKKINLRFKRVA